MAHVPAALNFWQLFQPLQEFRHDVAHVPAAAALKFQQLFQPLQEFRHDMAHVPAAAALKFQQFFQPLQELQDNFAGHRVICCSMAGEDMPAPMELEDSEDSEEPMEDMLAYMPGLMEVPDADGSVDSHLAHAG